MANKKGRIIAWSPDRDDSFAADATAWAERNGLRLSSVVIESSVICGGHRKKGTRYLLAELDKSGPLFAIVTREEPFDHPEMPEVRADLERAGVRFFTLADVFARASEPEPQPKKPLKPVAQRLLDGRIAGAAAGFHQSGPPPYGYVRQYVRTRSDGSKAPVLMRQPDEAEIVHTIFVQYVRLGSVQRLIDFMHAQGLRTRRKKRWSRPALIWILRNETYLGKVHFGDVRARGHHPAIVSPIIFNKARKLLAKNNKRAGKPPKH